MGRIANSSLSRKAIRLAMANAALWAVGNGLATTTLITYFAREMGAKGIAVSLILASATMVGLLRQLTPWLVAKVGSRKRFCLEMYAASAVILMVLPGIAGPGFLPEKSWSLAVLVVLWCLYQLCEYFATVALWSWLGDFIPERLRGSVLGQRESWLSGGRLVGMLASGLFTYYWGEKISRATLGQAYSLCAICGALFMAAAVVPLIKMPAFESSPLSKPPSGGFVQMFFAPLASGPFLRLMLYGCSLGAVNGLLGAAQFFYGLNVLKLSLLIALAMRCETEFGQTAISARVGKLIDRLGNRPVMMVSQLMVASAMVFYLTTTRDTWWWIFGASTMFIAYAGLNVGIPNLVLQLSPPAQRNAYVASYYAWAGLAYSLGSLAGGALFDYAASRKLAWYFGEWRLDHFALFFLAGLVLRSALVVLIYAVPECSHPGSKPEA
jgi:MFS family permease